MDPIYSCIKIALLSLYPDDTKISIYKNKIQFREPSVYQGILRWSYGEKRQDVLNLKEFLLNFQYLFKNSNFIYGDSIIKCLYKGINKLKFCYIMDPIIKENLECIESNYLIFYNSNGENKEKHIMEDELKLILNEYMENWNYQELEFINLNFKCIEKLQMNKDNEYKKKMIKTYIDLIDNFILNKIN